MGRLNANANANAIASLHGTGVPAPLRFNSLEYTKALRPGQFPSEPKTDKDKEAYEASQEAVNERKFRTYWDAELRASVYLNEFIIGHPYWLDEMTKAIDKKGLHEELHRNKGEQLRKMLEVADERDERFSEIIDQHDAEGAIKYWLGMLMIDPGSAPATYQLIRVARRVGEVVVMCLKQNYNEPRPSQISPAIVPLIDPPVTPSFPAGHALQSRLISKCLDAAHRLRDQREMLFELAKRVADNRIVAGLHYPLDNEAGDVAADICFEMLQTGKKFQELLDSARSESYLEWNPDKRPKPPVPDRGWRP
jgi:hypothetical protein